MNTKSAIASKRSNTPTRANRLAPAARRRQLVAAAIRVFAAQGIGETNHTVLAKEAGVAIPTVFHYFSSKELVVEAALDEVSRFLLEDLLRANDDPQLSASAAIERVLMSFCDAIDTHPDFIRVWLEWSVSIRGTLWKSYLEFYRGALGGVRAMVERGIVEGSLNDAIDPDDASRIIVGLAHMIVQMKFAGSTRQQVVHTVHSLVRSYLKPAQEN